MFDQFPVSFLTTFLSFPGGSDGKESTCSVGDRGSIPGWGRFPGEWKGNPLQYSCLENPHVQRSLVGYSSWGHKESDMTEQLSIVQHITSFCAPAVFLYWASLNPRFCFLLKFPTSLLSSSLNWWPHKSFKKENQTKFFHHSVMNLPSYSLLLFTIEETSFLSKAPVLIWILSLLFCSSLLSSLLSFPIKTELCSAVSHPKFCFDPPVFSSCYPNFLLLILLQLFKSVHILSLSLPQVPFTFSHCMTSDTTTPWNCYY